MTEPKICAYALGHLNHQGINNKVSACFRCSARLGSYDQQLMSEMVNGEAAREHRRTLMNGDWPKGCKSCQEFEEMGLSSTRTGGLQKNDHAKLLEGYDHSTGAIKHVRSIELRFGNECNLTCRHCGPAFSSRWEAIERLDPNIIKKGLGRDHEPHTYATTPGYHADIIENLVPHLNEIMFSGGETLYQKEHYEFITAIPPEHAAHIDLFYVTNGTVTGIKNHDALTLWKRFRKVTVVISTDGVGEQYEYFRQGADWKTVERNIRRFKEEGFEVETEITCSVYQMFYLTDTIDYLYDNGISTAISSASVQYPALLNQRIIPTEIKLMLGEQVQRWIDKMNDPAKEGEVAYLAQRQVNYMMGDNSLIYEEDGFVMPTWDDFSESVRLLDRLFKTSVERSFPRLAKHLTR